MNSYRISSLMRDQHWNINSRTITMKFFWASMTLLCCVFWGDIKLSAQEPTPSVSGSEQSYSIGDPQPDFYQMSQPTESAVDRGFGWTGRFGHQAGQAVGREESISNLELMPYLFNSIDGVVYVDGRLYRTNQSGMGGSIGLGYRQYIESIDRIFGVTFYYDKDDSRKTATFEQRVLSVESLGENLDARANFYMPTGERTKILATDLLEETVRFSGNFLLYDLRRTFGTAMTGVDGELGIPIRSEFGMKHNMKLHGGAYHFQDEDHVLENIWGWKTRITADLINNLNLNFEVTNDNVFKTSVQFGVVYNFDMNNLSLEQKHKEVKDRMLERVNRLSTTVVVNQDQLERGLVAVNPGTGNPYFFRHVDSANAGPGAGTFEDPFNLLSLAQADLNYDIIYVHADSVFNGADASVVTQEGKRILGEGQDRNGSFVVHQINEAVLGTINLPVNPTLGLARPIFNNAPGNGVVLNANSEFSGFVVQSPTLNGLVSNGVNHSIVSNARFLDILDAGQDGVLLQNVSGNILLDNNRIANPLLGPAQNGFRVEGGNANITFRDTLPTNGVVDSIIEYTSIAGNVVRINNTTGGSVNLDGTSITENFGNGISITNNLASVVLDTGTINDSSSTGINVTGNNNFINFNNDFVINRPTDVGFNIENNGVNGDITVGDITITDRENIGLNFSNNQNRLTGLNGTTVSITGNGLIANNEIALDYVNNTGGANSGINLSGLSIDESNAQGIRIGDGVTENNASFIVSTQTTINNVLGESVLVQNNNVNNIVEFNGDFEVLNRGDIGVRVENDNGATVIGRNNARISNERNVTDSAILLRNNQNLITFGNTFVEDTLVPSPTTVADPFATINPDLAGVFIDNNSNVSFNSLSISATSGDALRVNYNPATVGTQFSVTNGTGVITAANGTAVDLTNIDFLDANFASISSNGTNTTQYGIRILDSDGSFTVAGGTGGANPGGVINNHTFAGIVLSNTSLVDIANVDQQKTFSISGMLLNQNNAGIRVNNWTTEDVTNPQASEVNITNSTITNSQIYGIEALNTDSIILTNNTLSQNGLITFNGDTTLEAIQIRANRNRNGTSGNVNYNYEFYGNRITDENAQAVTITTNLADPSDLISPVRVIASQRQGVLGNTFTITDVDANQQEAFLINWAGDLVNSNFSNNTITINGTGLATGLSVNANGASGTQIASDELESYSGLGLIIANNTLTSNTAATTGFNINIDNSSSLYVNQNTMNIIGLGSTGAAFELNNSQLIFTDNDFSIGNAFGTGLLVSSIDTGLFNFYGNDFEFFETAGSFETGALVANITDRIDVNRFNNDATQSLFSERAIADITAAELLLINNVITQNIVDRDFDLVPNANVILRDPISRVFINGEARSFPP